MAKINMEVVRHSSVTKIFWYRYIDKEGKTQVKEIELEVNEKGEPVIGKISVFNKLYKTKEDAEKDENALDFAIKVTFN